MAQPIKSSVNNVTSKTKKKKRKPTVEEIIKKRIARSKKPHPKYGTSKLEKRFAKEFLDKMGVRYETQYEAKDIKRFYDFVVYTEYGSMILIEIDGSYYHGQGLTYEEKNPMQKRNEQVDRIKNEWAAMHGIPLIRIWESDINNNPSSVMKTLRENIGIYTEKARILENKKKRH